jgi:hypothetical protein
MNMTRVTTRRSVLGLGFIGFLALLSGCDSGVPPSTIESITDGSPGKAEADARKKEYGPTGQFKSQKAKSR